jgi:hypothetical protein
MIDGKQFKISNPAYEEWFATNQQVLGILFGSLSREVFTEVATARTVVQVWEAIQECMPLTCVGGQSTCDLPYHNAEGHVKHLRVLREDEVSR